MKMKNARALLHHPRSVRLPQRPGSVAVEIRCGIWHHPNDNIRARLHVLPCAAIFPTACRGHRWCACLSAPHLNALPGAVSRSPAPTPYVQTPPGHPPACRPRHGRCSSDSIPPQRRQSAPRPDNACDGRPPRTPHQSPPETDRCETAHPPPSATASPHRPHHRTPPPCRRRRWRPPYSSPPRPQQSATFPLLSAAAFTCRHPPLG